jgi:3-phosphoshikimate 1-carboxyvinyltransferase
MTETATFSGGRGLHGVVEVPGDKSISHRALLLSALAPGRSTISGLSGGEDVHHTQLAIEALGATVTRHGDLVLVDGGRDRLEAPGRDRPIDCGNSGTGMRLLAGLAAGLAGETVFTGDPSLSSRPMDRIARPLRLMGAKVRGAGEEDRPPLDITGGDLVGIDYQPPMASAQVKSAVLLAGLGARGETTLREEVSTRSHTEDMLAEAGADISVKEANGGRTITLQPSELEARQWSVPGDPSQAAFWIVGATIVPDSRLVIDHLYLGPERSGFLSVLERMGAKLEWDRSALTGQVAAHSCGLTATDIEAAEIPSLDEVPILAVAAAVAHGITRFRDVGELRVKESDRLVGTARLVEAFGAEATVDGDDLVITGRGGLLRPATFDAGGDHRMAMAAAVAGLATGSGSTRISGWECVATSYPGFLDDAAALWGGDGP